LYALGIHVPLLLFVAAYGVDDGGAFALAGRVSALPLSLVAGAVSQVFLAEAAKLATSRPDELRPLFARTTQSLLRTAIGPSVALMLLAPILAGPVLGSSWATTGTYIAVLAPMYFVSFVTTATGEVLYVVERQDLQLLREIIRLSLLGGAIPVAATLGLPALAAVAVLSAAGCATYVLYGLISWYALRRHHLSVAAETGETAATDIPGGSGP
jgi:O-antigen/teichoic acid export membrane protein